MSDRMSIALTHLADFLVVGAFGSQERAVSSSHLGTEICGTWPFLRDRDSLGGRYEEAFANAMAAHVFDWDDVMLGVPNHPGTVIWPTVLASAPQGATIRDAAESFLEGIGMAVELGHVLGIKHYRQGWHATATLGRMAAAYAGGFIRYKDHHAAWAAMQLSSIGSSGVSDIFGTSVKPVQVGAAAGGAAEAVHLIEFIDDMPDVIVPNSKLGQILGVSRPPRKLDRYQTSAATDTLRVKSHPACFYAHAPIHAASRIRELDFTAATAISVTVSPGAHSVCKVGTPRSLHEARFSLPYLVAAAGAMRGDDTLGLIDGSICTAQAVLEVAQKVVVNVDTGFGDMEALVIVDGVESRVDSNLHNPGVSRGLVANKADHESIRTLLAPFIREFVESEDGSTAGILDLPLTSLLVRVPEKPKEKE